MKTVEEIFKDNFNTLLEENNISQSEFAKKAGVGFQAVNRWANGHVSPTLSMIGKIADIFGVAPADILKEGMEKDKQIGPAFTDLTENYETLYAHLFGRESKPPVDIIQIFHMVATDVLTYAQWFTLVHRYNLDGYGYVTYRDMGERMNVTGQRVQQICARAEQKLRDSVEKFHKAEAECMKAHAMPVDLSEKSLKQIQSFISDFMIREAFDKEQMLKSVSGTIKDVPTQEIPCLSNHTKNALMRNKLYTLNSILSVSDDDLILMTGIGRNSVMEIRTLRKMYTDDTMAPSFEDEKEYGEA